ncbi:LapA family protein [Nocardioides litoris]|uniref:LapA family protein n=1 Tax=Nocardioides litoris TaxID=1926648 RepID=UPI0011234AE9|nr:LapA family protein [Nocardioides litoris]
MSQTPSDPALTPPTDAEPASTKPTDETTPPPPPPPTEERHDDPLRGSRISGAYAAVIAAAVLIVLLVIFVFQNTADARIQFLWLDGQFPLAAALLISMVAGMVVVALVGSLRILQLRRRVKRENKRGK